MVFGGGGSTEGQYWGQGRGRGVDAITGQRNRGAVGGGATAVLESNPQRSEFILKMEKVEKSDGSVYSSWAIIHLFIFFKSSHEIG